MVILVVNVAQRCDTFVACALVELPETYVASKFTAVRKAHRKFKKYFIGLIASICCELAVP